MNPEVAAAVITRSEWACEASAPPCVGRAEVMHHRRLRSQGGPDTVENLMHICNPCHLWLHAHPAKAAAWGMILRAGDRLVDIPDLLGEDG
jgi:5-methylcytosine-specific restriction endonuclease McrA